jgi:hypothetical protein
MMIRSRKKKKPPRKELDVLDVAWIFKQEMSLLAEKRRAVRAKE